MNVIASASRVMLNKTQNVILINTGVDSTAPAYLYDTFTNLFSKIRPTGVSDTPFVLDTLQVINSSNTSATLTFPIPCTVSVTVEDTEAKTFRSMQFPVNITFQTILDPYNPTSVYNDINAKFKAYQQTVTPALTPLELSDAKVFVDMITCNYMRG